ncbi:TPA: pilus assembly protein PilS, partial [Neisseria meningitidis]
MPSEARYGKLRQKQKPESHHSHSRESGFLGFRCFSVSMNFQAAVPDKYPQSKIPSFPRRWESRSVRTGTYAPSFPRKR